jgi:hypothetical protein
MFFWSCKDNEVESTTNGVTSAQVNFKMDMRKLWEDHITWTRNVIFNLVDNLPGTDQDLARLLKNQEDIGNAIVPYYGQSAGMQLTSLLKAHIVEAADVIAAAKANDQAKLAQAQAVWIGNADSIAHFLSNANPNLPFAATDTMMHQHLALTTNEVVARITKDYVADVAAYDAVHHEILMMSDAIADAIIKQFPSKF